MNKLISLLLCALTVIICVSCAASVSETDETDERGEAKGDKYLSVLEAYSGKALCIKTAFKAEFKGAADGTEINITRGITKNDTGYSVQNENGDTLLSGEELDGEIIRQGLYIEPYSGDIEGEVSEGGTVFAASPDISDYREKLLGSSVFFDGYELLSEESVLIKNLKYTARSQNGELVLYEYAFDLTVNDGGAYFTAHISVKTEITA